MGQKRETASPDSKLPPEPRQSVHEEPEAPAPDERSTTPARERPDEAGDGRNGD